MADVTRQAGPHPRRWQALALLGTAQFMLILDVTVVAIALPHLGADLDLGRDAMTWVISAYTLTFGGLMLLGGRIADLLGPGRVVYAGLVVFTGASVLTGLAGGPTTVLVGRILQGVGAALLSPSALSVVVRLFDGNERNRALGIWSALGGGGAAVGVLVGGLLTAGPGWPWVFFVNLPVGVVVIVALLRMLPPLPGAAIGVRLDLIGAVLVTGSTGLVIYAFIAAGDRGWASGWTLGALGAGLAGYLAFVVRLRTAAFPLLDPRLLARRPVAAGIVVLFIATGLMVSVFFLGSFYLQNLAGHGPLLTGVLFLPVAVATMAGAQLAGRSIGTLGGRVIGVAGFALAAAGLLTPAIQLSTVSTVIAVSVGSAGLGALFVVASATALSRVEPEQAGVASGMLSTFHELGASLGVAAVSGVAAAGLVAGSGAGFQRAYLVAGIIAAAGALLTALLVPGRAPHHID